MIPVRQLQLDLPSGTMLGKYEILRKLAMGGMAEIYLARAHGTAGFEKIVVIKRILPTVADDPAFVRMFLEEARLAATLQHPNIADVYEVGEHDGSPFFAMEFVHGQDVRAIKIAARDRAETVPMAIALAIVHGTASALDYAHDRRGPNGENLGLVHRDVSASNILVSYEGAIKLIDFGIARATNRGHQTRIGTLKGKVPYMSPEQCRGLPLDRRSDLFSLGIVMYELTVGRRPFLGENDFAVMEAIVHQGAPRPAEVMRGYPPELDAIVMRLLARNPDERYQTAEAMLHELDPFLGQHRLWVSPKALSRYMRTVFADSVAAWNQAAEHGVSLAQHVASTITSESQLSEMHTPPSAFPGIRPLSQEMPAIRPSSEISSPLASRLEPSISQAPPVPRPRSRILLVVIGMIVFGAGGFAGVTYMRGQKTAPAAPPEVQEPPRQMPVVKEPGQPDNSHPSNLQPLTGDGGTVVNQAPTVPEAAPTVPEAAPTVPEAAPTVPDKPAGPAVAKQPVKHSIVKNAPAKKEPKKEPVKEPPKDPAKWDPDSPVLPRM